MKITVTDSEGGIVYEGEVKGAVIECADSETAEPKPELPVRPGHLPTQPKPTPHSS